MKKIMAILMSAILVFVLISCVKVDVPDDIPEKPDENDVQVIPENPEISETPKVENVTLTLYFPDNDALYLHPESRTVEVSSDQLLAKVIVEELFKGPVSENLSPSLDGENLILSVKVDDGLCTVDFAEDFKLLNSGGTTRESFAIGSIVNSLCELEEIRQVKINIGGNTKSDFGGHFTLEEPFSPQADLIAK